MKPKTKTKNHTEQNIDPICSPHISGSPEKTKTEEEIFNDLCMKHQITFTDDRFNSAHLDWGELFAFYNATIQLQKQNSEQEIKELKETIEGINNERAIERVKGYRMAKDEIQKPQQDFLRELKREFEKYIDEDFHPNELEIIDTIAKKYGITQGGEGK